MKEVFEKILKKLNEAGGCDADCEYDRGWDKAIGLAIEIVKREAKEHNNGWIPCEVKMPPVETEVFILAKRKFKNGDYKYIRTTAMYEDGTVLENDSCWDWEDIEGEWDKENDCYIIPEGWWENRHYNPYEVYNNAVDDEVIAWKPLPEPYQPNTCQDINCPYNDGNECPAAEGCAGYERKQTNADRIRSMSDEDLAELIASGEMCAICPVCKYYCTEDCYFENEGTSKNCSKGIMEWLQSEG